MGVTLPKHPQGGPMFRKILIVFGTLLLLVALALGIFLSGGPEFPFNTDAIIAEAIKSEPTELVHGTTGYASSNTGSGDIKIWYEVNQPPKQANSNSKPKATILLIMGAGASSMLWPPDFIQAFVKAGYQVIRFDNRGTGLSDWMENWQQDKPYSLEDMAGDALAVLDANGVRRAHVIGTSMGGMIGQRLAISHGDRVLSLVSMSTSGYMMDPEFAGLQDNTTIDIMRLILKYALTGSETGQVKLWLGLIGIMINDDLQEKDVRDVSALVLYEMRKRRGFNPDAMTQHFAAMQVSGSRLDELKDIKAPVLVIHGTADAVLNIAHARKYAVKIPRVQTLWLEGAGHIIREKQMPVMMDAIFKLFESANW